MTRYPDSDYGAAYALAQRVVEDAPRKLLVKATRRALDSEDDRFTLGEVRRLVEFWRTMPEHITGGTAIQQLEAVLAGGFAPGVKTRK
jgi:hypothetical protein